MKNITIMYDISANKKRNRLVKILQEFGERVQLSVFEFHLTKAQHIRLMQDLKKAGFLQEHPTDRIRIYEFDQDQADSIANFGQQPSKDNDNLFYM